MSFLNSFFVILFVFVSSFSLSASESNLSTFKAFGIKTISLSVPKGRISLSSSKNQKDISVNVIEALKTKDNKKCVKKIGLEGSTFKVDISSENILFEKAECNYDVVVVVPAGMSFDTEISSGSAMVIVKEMLGSLSLKTASGAAVVNGEVLNNLDVKTATGNMEFSYKKCPSRADVNFLAATTKITMYLPADCKVRTDFKSATGKLFNGLGDSEDYLVLITAKSASGDFYIKKATK